MTCLNDLIKFKDYCKQGETGPFLSDYIDISTVFLAHLANDSEQSGKEYANSLIRAAQENLWADMLLSASDGYSVNNAVYYYNNQCRFTETYTNWGINLTNFFRSQNSKIFISEIKFKPELSGNFTIVVDDGVTLTEYSASGIAKTEGSISIDYSTNQKQVKIYAKDTSLKFAMQTCSSGGCGSCAAKRGVYLQMQGWNGTSINSQPTGFIPSAYIACDMEGVMCAVVSRHKALFSKALAYKVGIMAYTRLMISPRWNDTTLNIDKDAVKMYLDTLEAKSRELIWGTNPAYGNAAANGLIKIMQQTYKSMNDSCVICSSQVNTSTAVL